jgi:cytoskeletal protein RodZ
MLIVPINVPTATNKPVTATTNLVIVLTLRLLAQLTEARHYASAHNDDTAPKPTSQESKKTPTHAPPPVGNPSCTANKHQPSTVTRPDPNKTPNNRSTDNPKTRTAHTTAETPNNTDTATTLRNITNHAILKLRQKRIPPRG